MKKSLYFTVTLISVFIGHSLISKSSVPFWQQRWFERYYEEYKTVLTGDRAQLSNPEVIQEINQFLIKINRDPFLSVYQKNILVNGLGRSAQHYMANLDKLLPGFSSDE